MVEGLSVGSRVAVGAGRGRRRRRRAVGRPAAAPARGARRSRSSRSRCSRRTRAPASRWCCSSRAGSTSWARASRTAPRRSRASRCRTRAPTRGRATTLQLLGALLCVCARCWRSGRAPAHRRTARPRLSVPLARPAADPRRRPGRVARRRRAGRARRRPDRADGRLPVARAAPAAARPGHRGDARARRWRARCRSPRRPTARTRGSTTSRSPRGSGPTSRCAFDWGHSYGPLDWPREGTEVLRVATTRPSYWKMRNLDDFDGEQWSDADVRARAAPTPSSNWPTAGRSRRAGASRCA